MKYASNYNVFYHQINMLISYWCKWKLSLHLDSAEKYCVCVSLSFFFSFEKNVSCALWVSCRKRKQNYTFLVGPVHCSWDPQILYLGKKKNFKTGSQSIIHTFKNYFATVFSVFSKINGIQTDPKSQIFIQL